jgi:hypothetical protein
MGQLVRYHTINSNSNITTPQKVENFLRSAEGLLAFFALHHFLKKTSEIKTKCLLLACLFYSCSIKSTDNSLVSVIVKATMNELNLSKVSIVHIIFLSYEYILMLFSWLCLNCSNYLLSKYPFLSHFSFMLNMLQSPHFIVIVIRS